MVLLQHYILKVMVSILFCSSSRWQWTFGLISRNKGIG